MLSCCNEVSVYCFASQGLACGLEEVSDLQEVFHGESAEEEDLAKTVVPTL